MLPAIFTSIADADIRVLKSVCKDFWVIGLTLWPELPRDIELSAKLLNTVNTHVC